MPSFDQKTDQCRATARRHTLTKHHEFPANASERLALEFFARVWGGNHDLDAIDELMTTDYVITTAGHEVRGRENFKQWVKEFQTRLTDAQNETLEVFSNAKGDRVVSRWICRGRNAGIMNLPADGRPVAFSGIALWSVREGRLAECWVERAAWELYRELSGATDISPSRVVPQPQTT